MATKFTKVEGYLRRYDGEDQITLKRISTSQEMTKGGHNKITIAAGSSDISIMPARLKYATSFYLETDGIINVTMDYPGVNASVNLLKGCIFMNASMLQDVKLKNPGSSMRNITYDLTG